ncbi:MAG: hypothetical protein AB7O45_16715 [Alphaproteobacteria bacterium]
MSESMRDRNDRDDVGPADDAPGTLDRTWPPSAGTLDQLAAMGIGDRRAAGLFGVHPATYRAWRRRHRAGAPGRPPAGPHLEGVAFGYDPAAAWPAACRFEDDPRAARTDGVRLARPVTVVETGSTLALLVA